MATLPATPVVPAEISVANLLRVVMQRIVDGEELDGSARRALGTLVNFAMEIAATDSVTIPNPVIAPEQPTKSSRKGAAEGYYMWFGRYVKVQTNQAGTNTYAKVWDTGTEAWEYTSGLVYKMQDAVKLSAEDAHQFGALYGRCVFCSLQLNDERSITAGYGEICAENHGLPWG